MKKNFEDTLHYIRTYIRKFCDGKNRQIISELYGGIVKRIIYLRNLTKNLEKILRTLNLNFVRTRGTILIKFYIRECF